MTPAMKRNRPTITVTLDPHVKEALQVYVAYSDEQKVMSRLFDRMIRSFFADTHNAGELMLAIQNYIKANGEPPKFCAHLAVNSD